MGDLGEALIDAMTRPGMLVYLDGTNEHGTHVLGALPSNLPDGFLDRELAERPETAEEIMQAAEKAGYREGDLVWTEWHYTEPQLGEYGYVEMPGYWQFAKINSQATEALMRKTCETCQGNGEIVTDWDRYLEPHAGDIGDEAVAECPDCDGYGVVERS